MVSMEGITKTFGEFIANDNIDFSVEKGEVHALLGENGAGKSTLMNILAGLYRMTSGEIVIDGVRAQINNPIDARAYGIGMVHQHFMLVEAMTVAENIMLCLNEKQFMLNIGKAKKMIRDLSAAYALDVDPDKYVYELSVGEQQRVEIIKQLCIKAKILILDEPTAVLTPNEAQGLFDIIRLLKNEGHTIIFITHKLNEVMEICDRITVLRAGKKVATVKKAETTANELGYYMVARNVVQDRTPVSTVVGHEILSLRDVAIKDEWGVQKLNIDQLTVHAGEILGIAGVDGNGQSELAAVVTGCRQPERGVVTLFGKEESILSAKDFIDCGVAHIPEDRNRMGLVGEMSLSDNLVLKNLHLPPYSTLKGWKISTRAIHRHAAELIRKYDIRATSDEQETGSLSGGNQQKVILAREMDCDPKLLVAVHPTRGLDIGASEFMHNSIVEARNKGCGVLLISADLDEIIKLADRLAVIYEGRIIGYAKPENPDINKISLLMAGKEAE
jgi:simple sugar transport system ATP-binding protein